MPDWHVLLYFGTLAGYVAGALIWLRAYWRLRREHRALAITIELMLHCVVASYALKHRPTFDFWTDTLGADLEIAIQVQPKRKTDA